MFWLAVLLMLAPQRVISTAPSITEILFALGRGDRVVGVTTYCTYQEEAKTKAKIGGFTSPSIETIVSLRPDAVFVIKDRTDASLKLRAFKIRAVELEHSTVESIFSSIRNIAREMGVPERGDALVDKIRKEIGGAAKNSREPPAKVLFVVGHTPGAINDLYVAGAGSYLDELITLAGGTNVLGDSKIPYPRVSLEAVIARNPDVIIDLGNSEIVTETQKARVLALWNQWSFMPAVRNRAVFPISAQYFVTPGPRIGQAVRDIREMIRRAR